MKNSSTFSHTAKQLLGLSLLVFFVLLLPFGLNGQTFNGSIINTAGNTLIPSIFDGGCGNAPQTAATGGTRFNCVVAGAFGPLQSVLVNFTHTFAADIDMYLVSPAGAILELSTDNGSNADNFTNTVFQDFAPTNITAGTPPFTGTFLPEGTLTSNTCGITVTPTVTTLAGMGATAGTWQLLILDDAGIDVGTMLNWSLSFVCPATFTNTVTVANITEVACPSVALFDVTFDLRVTNTGSIPLGNLQLIHMLGTNLGSAFVGLVGVPTILVSGTNAATPPSINAGYNATSNTNLLMGTSSAGTTGNILPGQFYTVRMVARIDANALCGNPLLLTRSRALGTGTACGPIQNVNQISADTPVEIGDLMSTLEMLNFNCTYDECQNGIARVHFRAKVVNTGSVPVSNVRMIDNLATQMGAAFVQFIPGSLRYAFEQSSVATGPVINPAFNGAGSSGLFSSGATMNPCDEIVVEFEALINPALGPVGLSNQISVRGTAIGNPITDLSDSGTVPESNNIGAPGDTGCSDDATLLCLPRLSTPTADLTVNACDTWEDEIAIWMANNAGAVINNTCNTLLCVVNDYYHNDNPWQPIGTCGLNQTKVVHFKAKFTDVNGNMSEFCFCARITVVDNQPPQYDMLPMNKTVDCSTSNVAAQVQMWLANYGGAWVHACGGDVTVTNNYNGILPVCNAPRTVVFTASDNCGRSTTASATLTLTDTTPPTINNVPANTTQTCATNWPAAPNVTATDACGAATLTSTERMENITARLSGSQEVPARNTSATGTFTGTLSATGALSISVNFTGLTAPVTVAHLHTGAFGANGPVAVDLIPSVLQAGVTSGTFTGTVQLNATQIASLQAGNIYINIHTSTFPGGEIRGQLGGCARLIRTWTAVDACNNSTSASQTISVNDVTAPTITNVPANLTITCPDVPVFGVPTANDNCVAVALTFIDQTVGGPCPAGYNTTRTWTATDACGNTAVATSRITVNPPPPATSVQISCPPNITVNAAPGATTATATFTTPTTTTNCTTGSTTVTQSSGPASGQAFAAGVTTVCFTATNGCGNTASCCFTVTIVTSPPPPTTLTLTPPNGPNITCGQPIVFPTPTTSTTCPGGIVNLTQVDSQSGSACTGITHIRTYTATDACGNIRTATATVFQQPDLTAPSFTSLPPLDQMINCGDPINFGQATASDNCGSATVTSTVTNNGATACQTINGITYGYDLYVRWVATDACGNTTVANTNIWVLPVNNIAFLSKPDDKSVSCNEAIVFEQPMPKSFMADIVDVTFTDDAQLNGCGAGTVTRTWTALDAMGHTCQAQQQVTILPDTEKPTISLPTGSVTIDCQAAMPIITPIVSDNCTAATDLVVQYVDEQLGANVQRTYIVTDACGNINAVVLLVIKTDQTAPQFASVLAGKEIGCAQPVVFDIPVVSDACSSVQLTSVDREDVTTCVVTHTRVWTAIDAAGNLATASQVVVVRDTEAPAFAGTMTDQTITCAQAIVFDAPTVSDQCNTANLYFNDVQTSALCGNSGYTVTRTWTANDGCNNLSQATQKVHIAEDIQAPVVTGATQLEMTQAEWIVWTANQVTTSDDCGAITMTSAIQTIDNCNYVAVYLVTDACGNFASHAQNIKITDGPCVLTATSDATFGKYKLYPNPSAGFLNLELPTDVDLRDMRCEIYDAYGKLVLQRNLDKHTNTFEISALFAGTYWFKLTNHVRSTTIKFVKVTD